MIDKIESFFYPFIKKITNLKEDKVTFYFELIPNSPNSPNSPTKSTTKLKIEDICLTTDEVNRIRVEILNIIPIEKRSLQICRSLRNILTSYLLFQNWIPIHSALLALNDKGICIIGEKFQGKTTTLISLVASGYFDLLSNSKTFIKKVKDQTNAAALPVSIGIRQGTINLFPELNKIAQIEEEKRAYVKIQNLSKFYGTKILSETNVSCFVVPIHNLDISRPIIKEELDQEKKHTIIVDNILNDSFHLYLSEIYSFLHSEKLKISIPELGFFDSLPLYYLHHNTHTIKESPKLLIDRVL